MGATIQHNNKSPEIIIRLDDGEEFILKKNGMYSIRRDIANEKKGHLVHEYSYETLMVFNRNHFKIADGTEDLAAMRQRWFQTFEGKFNHHEDDEGCR